MEWGAIITSPWVAAGIGQELTYHPCPTQMEKTHPCVFSTLNKVSWKTCCYCTHFTDVKITARSREDHMGLWWLLSHCFFPNPWLEAEDECIPAMLAWRNAGRQGT